MDEFFYEYSRVHNAGENMELQWLAENEKNIIWDSFSDILFYTK